MAIIGLFLWLYTGKKHLSAPEAPPALCVEKNTQNHSPAVAEKKLKKPIDHAAAVPPAEERHLARQQEKASPESKAPVTTTEHVKRLKVLVANNDLKAFLGYLSNHGLDLNTQMDTKNRTRLFELWFPFTDDIGKVDLLKQLINEGAILDPPDHNTLTSLLFTGNPDILTFMSQNYPHVISQYGSDTMKVQALLGNPTTMHMLLEEGVEISRDTFSPEELIAIEQHCDTPECFSILEEKGIRFGERAVANAIIHGHLEALAHHAQTIPMESLLIDGQGALDIALETPKTNVSMIRFLETQGVDIEPRHLKKAKQNINSDGVYTLEVKSEEYCGTSTYSGFPFAQKVAAYLEKRLGAPPP
ncbi:hypothetical protein [Desulfoluna butyratoxydans]|uniref:Ankyrin repeat-containing domain n=1 Tax=Desulfoluna butyratoxydans TaxID=231438 RepID=A0A4U8YS00_9BACT|nr:hypothetical protein [Desulfoluna butyratoxydans]VFQ46257.1 ankyrin repeat-containing domain [Desulfoluna butyratoxydans]